MRVLVSNPSLQHTPHLVKALLQHNIDVHFATVFWFSKKTWYSSIIALLGSGYKTKLFKRNSSVIPDSIVITPFYGVFIVLIGKLFSSAEKSSFFEDSIHDLFVSQKIAKLKPTLIIGSEKSCLRTFRRAKEIGIQTILDLAQVHTSYIKNLRNKYDFFSSVLGEDAFFYKVCSRKQKEYEIADSIWVLSNFVYNTFLSEQHLLPKLKKVTLGIDYDTLCMPREKPIFNKLQVCYIGILTKRKGLHDLIAVINRNPEKMELHIAGSIADIKEEDIFESAIYYGHLDRKALTQLLAKCDVLVLPSYLDSWGQVVIEAMAVGLPVVTTSSTGASEAITPNCGFVINAGDYYQLEETLHFFVNNREASYRMGEEASQIAQRLTWEKYYTEIFELVNNTVVCAV